MKSLVFSLAAVTILLCAIDGFAQSPDGFVGPVRSSWTRVQRIVAASAEAMPEANYAFKPTSDVRTFGQLIGHLANEHYMICSSVKGEKNPHEGVDYEKTTAKADLVKALKDSNTYCDAAYALSDAAKLTGPTAPNRRDTPFSGLLLNVTHDSEHYGNIVTYLRMKGIVPPSSQPSR
jgi:uncharacterized damage-inducible protein DinB